MRRKEFKLTCLRASQERTCIFKNAGRLHKSSNTSSEAPDKEGRGNG
jgi:hypothetical protein